MGRHFLLIILVLNFTFIIRIPVFSYFPYYIFSAFLSFMAAGESCTRKQLSYFDVFCGAVNRVRPGERCGYFTTRAVLCSCLVLTPCTFQLCVFMCTYVCMRGPGDILMPPKWTLISSL